MRNSTAIPVAQSRFRFLTSNRKRKVLIAALLLAILGTGTFVYLRPRTISASPLTPNVEPRSLADIVNFTQLNNLHEAQLTPQSAQWENAVYTMDSFRGTMPIYSLGCSKYACPSTTQTSSTPPHLVQSIADPTTTDLFGTSVALGDINGDGIPDLIVGAPNAAGGVGQVNVYNGLTGALMLTINEPFAKLGDQFGKVVSYFSAFNEIAVGAPYHAGGSVWIFNSNGANVNLINSAQSFGASITIGNVGGQQRIFIGMPNATEMSQPNAGQVSGFGWDGKNAQPPFPIMTKLSPAAGDRFGASVALGSSSNPNLPNLYIGIPGDSSAGARAGSVGIYDANGGFLQTITNPASRAQDNFGATLAASFFDVFFDVAAPNATVSAQSQVGVAYTYDSSGRLIQTLNPVNPLPGSFYGYSMVRLPITGGRLIGSPGQSAVYQYDAGGRLVQESIQGMGQPGQVGYGQSVAAAAAVSQTGVLRSADLPVYFAVGNGAFKQGNIVYEYDLNNLRYSCLNAPSTLTSADCKVVESSGQLFPGTTYAVSVDLVAMSLWSAMNQTSGTTMVMTVVCDKNTVNATIHCSSLYIDGNNWGPDRQSQTKDPFIIVNAEPYWYLRWHWWDPFNLNIITWSYWWNDSHSHPNWYWGVYWWWRTYVGYYIGTWMPWWWYWWSWQYWQYWDWWSTYFPYSNQVIV